MLEKHFTPPQPPVIDAFYNTNLPKLRIDKFKIINSTAIIVSLIYTLFIILTIPSSPLTKVILLFMGLGVGSVLIAYFYFTQDQEFTIESNQYVIFTSVITLAAAIQISGGVNSPFIFFYVLIVIFTALTVPNRQIILSVFLISLLIIAHALLPTIDILEIDGSNKLNFFIITWGKVVIITSYAVAILLNLVNKDEQLVAKTGQLEGEITKLKKFNLLTQTYQSLGTLRGTLNYDTLKQLIPMTLSKLLSTDFALLYLKEDEEFEFASSWSNVNEGKIDEASFSKCSIDHNDRCLVNRMEKLHKVENISADDLTEDCSPPCSAAIKNLKSKDFIMAPLNVADKNLGVIILGFPEKKEFQWDEKEVLRIFTYTTVLAIENARYYNKTRENFEKYNSILTELIDAVVAVDKNGKIIFFNDQASKLFGIPSSDAVGIQVRQVLFSVYETGKKTPLEDTAIFKSLRTGEVVNIPRRFYKRPNGSLVPATVSAKSFRDSHGKPIGVMLLIRNLEPEIELERARNEFISVASRELQTPVDEMRDIIKSIKNDKEGDLSTRQKNFLDLATKGNDRLKRLIGDLLRVSQIDKGKIRIIKKSFDIRETTKETVEDFIYRTRRNKLNLSYKMPKKPLKVKASPTHLREILAILLGNALKYTKTGGSIEVSHQVKGNKIVTHVKDSGPPINKEDMKNLFQKFYRSPEVAVKIEGTGLGLYIVKQLVELMDGDISVKSNTKIGVDFIISLPKA